MFMINLIYNSENQLHHFIHQHRLTEYKNLLIQIFTSIVEYEYIQRLIETIRSNLPNAKIIGTTSDGNIVDGLITHQSVLSFIQFDKTEVHSFIALSSEGEESYDLGVKLANQFKNIANIEATIAFSDGIHTNGEEFLKGLESVHQNSIAGGMASDNGKLLETYVFNEEKITHHGAVCATLSGEGLLIHQLHNFGWRPIGKRLKVTKSIKNRVYEIEGRSAVETYKRYLGEQIEAQLPQTGIEFPLIIHKEGLEVARASIQKHEDGSLSFAGNIEEGSMVQFGLGDVNAMLYEKDSNFDQATNYPVEAIFIYSCMARRRLLDIFSYEEIQPYHQLAPVSGCFTNGEFYCCKHQPSYNLLNQSKTMLLLSESEDIKYQLDTQKLIERKRNTNRIEALTHLVTQTSNELMEVNNTLESRVEEGVSKVKAILDATQSMICIFKDASIIQSNLSFATFFRDMYSPQESCKIHHYLIKNGRKDYIYNQFIEGCTGSIILSPIPIPSTRWQLSKIKKPITFCSTPSDFHSTTTSSSLPILPKMSRQNAKRNVKTECS